MSDSSSEPIQATAVDKAPDAPKPTKKGSTGLRIVLILIMLVMFGLLGYDRYVRAASEKAYDKLAEWVAENKSASPEEVHELLGRKPDSGLEKKEHYWEETYTWRAGSLYKSYFLIVYYEDKEGEPSLYELVFNDEPTTNDIPNPPPPELTEEEIEAARSVTPEGGEFSNGGSGEETPTDGEATTEGESPSEGSEPPAEGDEPSDGEESLDDSAPADPTEGERERE